MTEHDNVVPLFDGAACLDSEPDSEFAAHVRASMQRHPCQGNSARIKVVDDE
jgi:hypothetical protein